MRLGKGGAQAVQPMIDTDRGPDPFQVAHLSGRLGASTGTAAPDLNRRLGRLPAVLVDAGAREGRLASTENPEGRR
jgi:hypothetical protein